MQTKLDRLMAELEVAKRDGRQTVLAIASRQRNGEDAAELYHQLDQVLARCGRLYGLISRAHRWRACCWAGAASFLFGLGVAVLIGELTP